MRDTALESPRVAPKPATASVTAPTTAAGDAVERASLMATAPLQLLMKEYRTRLDVLRDCDPHGAASATLSYVVNSLSKTMKVAATLEHEVGVREAAEMTGMSEEAIRWNAARNRLPHRRVGRSYRFQLSVLNDWMAIASTKEKG